MVKEKTGTEGEFVEVENRQEKRVGMSSRRVTAECSQKGMLSFNP